VLLLSVTREILYSSPSLTQALPPMHDDDAMALALAEAREAARRGEVPVGAVLLDETGEVLAHHGNMVVERRDPTAHAEVLVLREAALKRVNERLVGTTLFVTLEPCAMCAGAISLARVARLVFAAEDPKGGAVLHGPRFFEQPTCHHRAAWSQGTGAHESAALLKAFFRERRG
jgi:tRNA(adenine34) deaminase